MEQAHKCLSGSHYAARIFRTELPTKTDWENTISDLSDLCHLVLFCLISKSEEDGFLKFVLSSTAAQEKILASHLNNVSYEFPVPDTWWGHLSCCILVSVACFDCNAERCAKMHIH